MFCRLNSNQTSINCSESCWLVIILLSSFSMIMNWLTLLQIVSLHCLMVTHARGAITSIIPRQYTLPTPKIFPVNGSLANIGCERNSNDGETFTCLSPAESVLFDEAVPNLADVDFTGNKTWARGLLTLRIAINVKILFDIQVRDGIAGVKVVLFNCPEWEIYTQSITLIESTGEFGVLGRLIGLVVPPTSCDSLVSVCLLAETFRPSLSLLFSHGDRGAWMHVAEVTFLSRETVTDDICDVSTVISTVAVFPTSTISTSAIPKVTTASTDTCITATDQSVIISGVVSAIVAAVLMTVAFTTIQILICKCHPKLKLRGKGRQNAGEPDGEQDYLSVGDPQDLEVERRDLELRLRDRAANLENTENGNGPAIAGVNPLIEAVLVGGAEYEDNTSGSYVCVDGESEYEEVRDAEQDGLNIVRNQAYGVRDSSNSLH